MKHLAAACKEIGLILQLGSLALNGQAAVTLTRQPQSSETANLPTAMRADAIGFPKEGAVLSPAAIFELTRRADGGGFCRRHADSDH
jgi:hypothetical protein